MSFKLPERVLRRVLVGVVALFFLAPYVLLLPLASLSLTGLPANTTKVFLFTFEQAGLSALFTVLLAVPAAMGLSFSAQRLPREVSRVIDVFVLAPCVAPVLATILAVYKFFPFMKDLFGIVFVHVFINLGVVSLGLREILHSKLGGFAELAWLEGAGHWRFFWRVGLPLLRADLTNLFLLVFVLSFASLSVPMMLGGTQATTVEVLIWQELRNVGDFSSALSLAVLQFTLIAAFSFLFIKTSTSVKPQRVVGSPLTQWPCALILSFIAPIVLVLGLSDSVAAGIEQISSLVDFRETLGPAVFASFILSMLVGASVGAVMLAIAFVNFQGRSKKVLLAYVAPSAALVAFAILVIGREMRSAWQVDVSATGWVFLQIALALTMISLPTLFRWRWSAAVEQLAMQRDIAKSLGANDWLIMRKIVVPQLAQPLSWVMGMAAVWAWGDFAVSTLLAPRSMTVAMLSRDLLESYRLPAASAMIWVMLIGAGFCFLLFSGVRYVVAGRA